MNPYLKKLNPYPFEKIRALLDGVEPPNEQGVINFAIGEPKHPPPEFVIDILRANMSQFGVYPSTKGIDDLRHAICAWLSNRFQLNSETLNPQRHVLPVNGTREALFSFAQAIVDTNKPSPLVVSPNPFYQIYEGATFLAGATPWFINSLPETGFLPDFDSVPKEIWERCQLIYICSPGNPTGAVIPLESLQRLILLADEFDFVIASDECYSELYPDENAPPPGILQACAAMGRTGFDRCIAFHSLSKRSNLPGLRSGFVAGDAAILEKFLLYRTYHGCAMPVPNQMASISAWRDEEHVVGNRQSYRRKFATAIDILSPVMDVSLPEAGFYLWAKTPIADHLFARELYRNTGVRVVPGQYLARETPQGNPGANRIRMALVAPESECEEGMKRVRQFIENL